MKQLLLISSLLFSTLLCYAQEPYDEKIWDYPDSLPEFPGGKDSLFSFIDENLIYPLEVVGLVSSKEVKRNQIAVEFIIEKDGHISNIAIRHDGIICVSCGKEAISVMELSPQWEPGYTHVFKGEPSKSIDLYPVDDFVGFKGEEDDQRELEERERGYIEPEASNKIKVAPEVSMEQNENQKLPFDTTPYKLIPVKAKMMIPIRFKYEKLPELPYGIDSLTHYINTNLVYPERVLNEKFQGKVDVKLMFDETGELKDVLLLQGMENCPECDEEALILIQNMPKDLMRANDSPNSPKPYFFNTFIEFRLE